MLKIKLRERERERVPWPLIKAEQRNDKSHAPPRSAGVLGVAQGEADSLVSETDFRHHSHSQCCCVLAKGEGCQFKNEIEQTADIASFGLFLTLVVFLETDLYSDKKTRFPLSFRKVCAGTKCSLPGPDFAALAATTDAAIGTNSGQKDACWCIRSRTTIYCGTRGWCNMFLSWPGVDTYMFFLGQGYTPTKCCLLVHSCSNNNLLPDLRHVVV